MIITEPVKSFKTVARPGPTSTLLDRLFSRKAYKIWTQDKRKTVFDAYTRLKKITANLI